MHDNEKGLNLDYGQVKSDAEEGKMFRSTLATIIRKCEELSEVIQNEDDLPQWCHYKVAKSADNINSLHDYLIEEVREYTDDEGEELCIEEKECDPASNFKDIFTVWNSFINK